MFVSNTVIFQCAKEAGADFKEDKTLYCMKHAQRYGYKENVTEFGLERAVWVDREAEEERARARKTRRVDYRDLAFSLGSLQVESLGSIVPASQQHNVSFKVSDYMVNNFFFVRLLFLLTSPLLDPFGLY